MTVLQKFSDQETALQAITFLRNNGIDVNLSQRAESGAHTYLLEVAPNEIELATELLATLMSEPEEQTLDMDDYTDEELSEIIVHSEDYANATVELAKQELKKRTPQTDIRALEVEHEKHVVELVEELSMGKSAPALSIALGYALALAGGIIGLAMGWFIETGKTIAPTGESFFTYDSVSRMHGKRIKWIGIVIISLVVILRLVTAEI